MHFKFPSIAALALFAQMAAAQAPPGIGPSDAPPGFGQLAPKALFGGALGGEGNHMSLSGSFTVEKGTRNGVLTLAAQIDPGWHIYSLTQKSGGPQKSEIKVDKSPSFELAGLFTPDRPPHIKPPDVF